MIDYGRTLYIKRDKGLKGKIRRKPINNTKCIYSYKDIGI